MAAEPPKKRPREASAGAADAKQHKKTSPMLEHLHIIRLVLNITARTVDGIWSTDQTNQLSLIRSVLENAIRAEMVHVGFGDDSSDDSSDDESTEDAIVYMKGLVQQLISEDPSLEVSLRALQTELAKKLPSEYGEDVREGKRAVSDDDSSSSDEDDEPPEMGANSEMDAVSDDSDVGLTDSSDDEELDSPTAPMTEAAGRRKKRKPLPPIGSTVRVTLQHHKGKHNKLTRLLSDGPQELVLMGTGVDTLTFSMPGGGAKKKGTTLLRSNVTFEEITGIDAPDTLLPEMLLEMRWEGDPQWYPVRYAPALDGTQSVILISDGSLLDFDSDSDEWRYPNYSVFVETDLVRITSPQGPRMATVMQVEDEHVYICEWNTKRPGDDKNFVLDVFYTVAVKVEEDRQVSEASEEDASSEEEEDNIFDEGDLIEKYNGKDYRVKEVHSTDDGYEYTLKNKEGILRVSEQQIQDSWDPKFSPGDDVVYGENAAVVVELDYANRRYEIVLDDAADAAPPLVVSQEELVALQELTYDEGVIVFFNFGYYQVVSNRLAYTLMPEGGGPELVHNVTDDDLMTWVLVLNPKSKTNDIMQVVRQKDKKVKGVYLPFYEVVDKNGKKKDIRAGSKNIKEQADAEAFFQDAMVDDDDDLDAVIVFEPGERVTVIGAGSSSEEATVIRRIPGADLDDEKYEIDVDGVTRTVPVGLLAKIGAKKVETITEEIGDTTTDEEGNIWTIVKFKDGQAVWKMEDSDSDSDSDDSLLDSDEEDDSDFKVGTFVTVGDHEEVYEVKEAKNNVYTVVCAWDENLEVEDISVNDLKKYENEFSEGDEVLHEGKEDKIVEAHADGTYVLTSGEEVTEDELEKYIGAFKKGTIVRRVGSGVVYKVKSHNNGEYTLISLADKSEHKAPSEEVDLHEEPLFKKEEYAQLSDEEYPRKVKKFKKKNWSYRLEGLEREFREMELREPAAPEFDKGDKVVIKETGEESKVKKVIPERGSYLLKNGKEVKEEDLEAVEDDE